MGHTLSKGTILQGSAYRYEIVRTLGQGTFGITYLANAQIPGPLGTVEVQVALKEFFMRDINSREDGSTVTGSRGGFFEDYRRKFRREALNLSHIQHPNIVKVLEMFDANGTSYIAMNYLDGGSLDNYIQHHGHLTSDEALAIICPVADALRHMHEAGMLHLDLKPGNIMLTSDGKPVIIDFGLSKQYDESGNPESSTAVGAGTPGYAPIEQSSYREGSDFPVSMDIYALGATLFKMLTGHRPPDASVIFNDGFPEANLDKPWITPHLRACVLKAMAPRRNDRYHSVAEFLAALGGAPAMDEATAFVGDSDATEIVATKKPRQENVPTEKSQPPVSPAPAQKKLTPPPAQKKNNLWWIFVILGVAVVVAIIFLARGFGGNAENDEEADLAWNKDYKDAYDKVYMDSTIDDKTDDYNTEWEEELIDVDVENYDDIARDEAVYEAAEAICNCASGDQTPIQECLRSVINTDYAAYQNDEAFKQAVYERAMKCAVENAANKAIEKGVEKLQNIKF